MGRPLSKTDLMHASQANFEKLNAVIASMSEKELDTPFDFSADPKKKEAHWKRDKNLRDVLVHLYEWHRLLLNWVSSNAKGEETPFLIPPYNWKTYGDMNVALWEKHQNTTQEDAERMVRKTHGEVMALAETFSDEELFTKDVFPWVGGSTLGSYFVSVTASHYDWALKKLNAHKKNCQ
ncbi:MAG: ClbS/DfsB family four-helix bundle protein [Christensenellales bacterium]|jgi:hypothetical protein